MQFTSKDEAFAPFTSGATVTSIVIFKVDHVGDFALAIDALTRLRSSFPKAWLTLVCGPWNTSLAEASGLFDEVIALRFFSVRADGETIVTPPRCPDVLRDRKVDLALDLRVDEDTRVLLDDVEARYRFGYYSRSNRIPLTVTLTPPDFTQAQDLGIHQNLMMMRLVGTAVDFFRADAASTDFIRQNLTKPANVDLSFADGRVLVVCNTSSGRAAKNWPLERYIEIIDWLLRDMQVSVLLIGTKDEAEQAQAIEDRCASPHLRSAIGQTSLAQAIWLIDQADLYLGNDTGLTHFAAQLGRRTIAIYSGIDPTDVWAPRGSDVTVVKAPVPCSPCHILILRDCRNQHACIRAIDVSYVQGLVRNKLLSCCPRKKAGSTAEPTMRKSKAPIRVLGRSGLKVLLLGNCQIQTYGHLLRSWFSRIDLGTVDFSKESGRDEASRLRVIERYADADLVLTQPYHLHRGHEGELLDQLGGRVMVFANFYHRGPFPDICTVGGFGARLTGALPIHSWVIIDSFLRGLTQVKCRTRFNREEFGAMGLLSSWDESLAALRKRDEDCHVPAADFIDFSSRRYLSFYVPSHPTIRLAASYLGRVLASCGLVVPAFDERQFVDPMASHDIAPVYDFVAEHYRLPYRTPQAFRPPGSNKLMSIDDAIADAYAVYSRAESRLIRVHSPEVLVRRMDSAWPGEPASQVA